MTFCASTRDEFQHLLWRANIDHIAHATMKRPLRNIIVRIKLRSGTLWQNPRLKFCGFEIVEIVFGLASLRGAAGAST
ncbi:Uncharacterised protein [Vibrio cholerae]|nr:Uncharacterised protein [Vibrio cholerae]